MFWKPGGVSIGRLFRSNKAVVERKVWVRFLLTITWHSLTHQNQLPLAQSPTAMVARYRVRLTVIFVRRIWFAFYWFVFPDSTLAEQVCLAAGYLPCSSRFWSFLDFSVSLKSEWCVPIALTTPKMDQPLSVGQITAPRNFWSIVLAQCR